MKAERAIPIITVTYNAKLQTLHHDARFLGGDESSQSSRSRFNAFSLFSFREDGEPGRPGGGRGASCNFVNVFSESGVTSLSSRPLALCTRESVRFLRNGVAGREGGVGRSMSVSEPEARGSSATLSGMPSRIAL